MNLINRSFDWVQVVKHALVIASHLQILIWVWVHLMLANARSRRQAFEFAIKVRVFILSVTHDTETDHILV